MNIIDNINEFERLYNPMKYCDAKVAPPLDRPHLVAVRGLIHQEVPECVNEESSTERHS